jgi:extradiol dioxygenase family protein
MFIVFFGTILLIYSLIDYFAYRKWSLLYIALRHESYFALTEKLKQAGIKYRIKNIYNKTGTQCSMIIGIDITKFTLKRVMKLKQHKSFLH